jgi:hypothetical protein
MYFPGKIGHFLENWICLAYIPETVMNCDDDYVNTDFTGKIHANALH